MKKLFIAVLASLVIFLTGCIDVQMKVNLNPDGSGTIEETVLMSGELVEMMKSFALMGNEEGEEGEEEAFSLYDQKELMNEALEYGEGVTLLNSEAVSIDGMEGYKAVFKFDDINKIKLDANPTDKMPSGEMEMEDEDGFDEEEEEPIRFSFSEGNPSSLKIMMPEPDMDDDDEEEGWEDEEWDGEEEWDEEEVGEEMTEQAKEMMKDMHIKMSINFNGDIVETNASNVEGSEIILVEMDFGKLLENPEKFEQLKNKEPETMEEAKELFGDVDGFKFEFNPELEVKFK